MIVSKSRESPKNQLPGVHRQIGGWNPSICPPAVNGSSATINVGWSPVVPWRRERSSRRTGQRLEQYCERRAARRETARADAVGIGRIAMARVIVVDDSGDIAKLLCEAVDLQPDLECVETLSSAEDLEQAVQRHSPDVVLLDLYMPGRDPLDAVRAVAACASSCRILVFTGYGDAEAAKAVLDAGAWGLVSKLAPREELFEALRRVAAGEMVFDAEALDKL
jgi:CheY-like chemotaxis protein